MQMKIEIPELLAKPPSKKSCFNTLYGSYGIVVSNPRTPLENETCAEIQSLNQVAKLFFTSNEFEREISKYNELRSKLDHLIFLFEKSSGLSNKNEIITNACSTYNSEWYDCGLSAYDIYAINRYLDYENFIDCGQIYQMVFDKMVGLESIEFNAQMFEQLIHDLNEIIESAHSADLYIDDLKADNIVYNPVTSRFMLIDLTCLVSTKQVLNSDTTWNKNNFAINDPFVLYTLNPNKFRPHLYRESEQTDILDFYWSLINWPNLYKFKRYFETNGSDLVWLLKFSNQFSLGLLLAKLGCEQGVRIIESCAQQINLI